MSKTLSENDIRMIEGNLNRISLNAQKIAKALINLKEKYDPLINLDTHIIEILEHTEHIRNRIKY